MFCLPVLYFRVRYYVICLRFHTIQNIFYDIIIFVKSPVFFALNNNAIIKEYLLFDIQFLFHVESRMILY